MTKYSMRKLAGGALALFLIAGFMLVDSSAQKRRRKRKASAPRITNPAIYQPSANDNANTAGDTSNTSENANSQGNTQNTKPSEDPEEMKRTIRSLSSQVDKLSDKLGQMQEDQRSLVDLERLSRGEQRSAQLHGEMRDVQAKEAELQARLEDINYALKPENIERATAGVGSTHPEEVREQRRKQLEAEKLRVQGQLDHLAASRASLEQAIAAAESEVDRLRKKLDVADQAAIENAKRKAQAEASSQSSQSYSSPTPTPNP
jgi:chromosome segregation ATPase